MEFEINSYKGAGPIRFGETESSVVEVLGEPKNRTTNFRGDQIFDYKFVNVGFSKDGRVNHIGFIPGSNVSFENVDLFEAGSFEKLLQTDGDPKEVVGIIVLLNLGVAFSGFHDGDESQKAVTVFATGGYDRLKSRMRPFRG